MMQRAQDKKEQKTSHSFSSKITTDPSKDYPDTPPEERRPGSAPRTENKLTSLAM